MDIYDYFFNGGRDEWKEKEKTFTAEVENSIEETKGEDSFNPLKQ